MTGTSRLVVVVGPTAAGKSDFAVELAQRIGGEIVNADSMQLYEGMDIGTAKLASEERRGVRHHLLDVWPVTYPASLAEYQQLARDAIREIRQRDAIPILVGGSGMYVHAVVDEWDIPTTEPEVRQRLEDELQRVGPQKLHERLAELDPDAAASILPTNGRRIVRAIEVLEMGGSFSAQLPAFEPRPGVTLIGLRVDRPDLDGRIERRVDSMWQAGLVDEVRQLEACGLRDGPTSSRALGYSQVLRFLAGETNETDARAETVRATKRFARRQESWFRRDPRIEWQPA